MPDEIVSNLPQNAKGGIPKHTLKGRVLVTILSVSFVVAIWSFGCATSSTPDMGTTDKNEVSNPK